MNDLVGAKNKLILLFGFLHTFVTSSGEDSNPPEDKEVTQEPLPHEDDALAKVKLPRNLPHIVDIKKVVPAHCFEPKVSTSVYYMCKDFVLITVTFFVWKWLGAVLPLWILIVLTPIYWLIQGTFFTAVFVVGHDAGHGSFSKSDFINTVCGNICHTFLLCPYYMWKLSHRKHHKNTGNIDKDEVFYPVRKKLDNKRTALPGFGLGIGWFGYLMTGYRPRSVEHFNPFDKMFRGHLVQCLISLGLIVAWIMCLLSFREHYGWLSLASDYAVPVTVFASYIVIITFLHHTDDEVPWYSDHLWTNVRGQLSSVDRSYGWCHNIIHNIGTHQIHHLLPKVPHYYLEEATAAFREAYPKLVVRRSERILPAFLKMFQKYKTQVIIPDDTEVHLYK